MSKEISIITTVYNGSKYLEQCLDSIMAQTFRNFELILVDDGSTDDSGEIADKYANDYPEMISVIHQKNGGTSVARNAGIEAAIGKYVGFVDADDKIEKEYLGKLYNACNEHDSDSVVCGYTRFDDNDKILGRRNAKDWEMMLDNGKNYVFSYIACARLYKTSLIKKSGILFSEGERFEDVPFNIYMNITAQNCVAIDYEGYLYRVNENSLTEIVQKKGISSKKQVMHFPYHGFENMIVALRKNYGHKYDEILYYELAKNFVGLLFLVAESSSNEDIREVSSFEQGIFKRYFADVDVRSISYFQISRLRKLPFSYRVAAKIYMSFLKKNKVFDLALTYRKFKGLKRLKNA